MSSPFGYTAEVEFVSQAMVNARKLVGKLDCQRAELDSVQEATILLDDVVRSVTRVIRALEQIPTDEKEERQSS